MKHLPPALLILGPTGSGKTPLGETIAERGLGGESHVHFDFGENLRHVVARNQPDALVTAEDIAFLRYVLATGALLEDEQFPIAARILHSFLSRHAREGPVRVVLNGLPRHVGQASGIESMLTVVTVVRLSCDPDTVYARIAGNTGGDRSGRDDDAHRDISRKLAIFDERTTPLIEHYQARGARILALHVTVEMTAAQMWQQLESRSEAR